MTARIILASTSVFRQSLLQKFNIPFEVCSPRVDETAIENETAEELVKILGKPHTRENAIAQLMKFSGQKVQFLTGLALVNSVTQEVQVTIETFNVYFRTLTEKQIAQYVDAEQPLNCAGSFKSEGLGICLFERFEGRDPNSLIGLPLMALNEMLLTWQIDILSMQG